MKLNPRWRRVQDGKNPPIGRPCIVAKRREPNEHNPAHFTIEFAQREPDSNSDRGGAWSWSCADGEMAGSQYFDAWTLAPRVVQGEDPQI